MTHLGKDAGSEEVSGWRVSGGWGEGGEGTRYSINKYSSVQAMIKNVGRQDDLTDLLIRTQSADISASAAIKDRAGPYSLICERGSFLRRGGAFPPCALDLAAALCIVRAMQSLQHDWHALRIGMVSVLRGRYCARGCVSSLCAAIGQRWSVGHRARLRDRQAQHLRNFPVVDQGQGAVVDHRSAMKAISLQTVTELKAELAKRGAAITVGIAFARLLRWCL